MTEYLGWFATAVFVLSYFFKRPATLRQVQMTGAFMWVGYGLLIGAAPVVAANTMVLAAAAWTLAKQRAEEGVKRDYSAARLCRWLHRRPAP